jgi:hypothetical protein
MSINFCRHLILFSFLIELVPALQKGLKQLTPNSLNVKTHEKQIQTLAN